MLDVRATWWSRIPLIGNLGAPIILKEVFSLVRRNRWFWSQFIYLLVLAAGMAVIYASSANLGLPPEDLGSRLVNFFFMLQVGLVCLIFPGLAATSISAERTEKSFDLLIVSDLSPAELVWGKLIGILGTAFYFLVSTLPILGVCIFLGGLSPVAIILDYLYLFLIALIVSSWGIFISAMSKNNLLAIIGSYAIALPLAAVSMTLSFALLEQVGARGLLEAIRMLPPEFSTTVISSIVVAIGSFLGICLLGAMFFLSSPESLRGTPIRIFVTLLVLIDCIGTVSWWQLAAQQNTLRERHLQEMGGMTIVFTCFLMLILIAVAGGRVETPLRAVYLAKRQPKRWLAFWPLVSGGIRGPLLATGLLFFTLGTSLSGMLGLIDQVTFSEGAMQSGVVASWNRAPMTVVLPWITQQLGAWVFAYISFAFLLSTLGLRGGINWFLTAGVSVLLALLSIGRVAAMNSRQVDPDIILFSPLVTLITRTSDGSFANGTVPYDACFYGHWIAGGLCWVVGMILLRNQKLPILKLRRPAYDFLFTPRSGFAATPELAAESVEPSGTESGSASEESTGVENAGTTPEDASPPKGASERPTAD